MMEFSRRETLLAAGGAIGLAGCRTGFSGRKAPDESDVFRIQTLDEPVWARPEDATATGFVTLLESADDRAWMAGAEEADGLDAWLRETDFDRSVVVFVQTRAANTCFEARVRDVAVTDDAITGTLETVVPGDGPCGQAITYPGAFVRVTGSDLPSTAEFTVDGETVVSDGQVFDPSMFSGKVRPPGDPEPMAPLSCDDENFTRLPPADGEVAVGEARDENGDVTFAMRFHIWTDPDDRTTIAPGERVRVKMHNLSTEVQSTGGRHEFTIEALTTDGWQPVRGSPDGERPPDKEELVQHEPGAGFEWTFAVSEDGLAAASPTDLTVCPDLRPGRYRFVYHEAAGRPLAIEFDLVR